MSRFVNLKGKYLAVFGIFKIDPVSVLPLNSIARIKGASFQLGCFESFASFCIAKNNMPMLYGSVMVKVIGPETLVFDPASNPIILLIVKLSIKKSNFP